MDVWLGADGLTLGVHEAHSEDAGFGQGEEPELRVEGAVVVLRVETDFQVQMGAGGRAAHADLADFFSGGDSLTSVHVQP